MKKTIILIFSIFIVNWIACSAQTPELKVESMNQLFDPMTVEMQRKDLNGALCGLVKVILPVSGCEFEGNVIGTPQYKVNEYWVYLSPGSKSLQIKCPGHYPIRLDFQALGIPSIKEKGIYQLIVKSTASNTGFNETQLLMPSDVKDLQLSSDISMDYKKEISVTDLIRHPMGFVKAINKSIWEIPLYDYLVAADKAREMGIFVSIRESELNWLGVYMKDERKGPSTLTVDAIPLWQTYPIIEKGNKLQGFGYMFAPFYGASIEDELDPKKIMKLLTPLFTKIKNELGFKQIKRSEYVKLIGYAYGEDGAFFKNEKTSEVISFTVTDNTSLLEIRKF